MVATCYLLGVSTRRMERLVESLGITRLSRSQVCVMARELDEPVAAFRTRPLDQGPYTFVAADALVLKVREGGRVVGVHALVATGVNADGHREILGLDVTSAEDGAGWLAFFRDLVARGLTGVRLVTSDAHAGLIAAIGATLPGASWQRCRTHWNCKEITCSSVLGRRMMWYAHRRRRFVASLRRRFEVLLPHLNERQQRLALATEARLLGHGGVRAVARGGRGQRDHGAPGRGRAGGRRGAAAGGAGPPGRRRPQARQRA